jgi:hypothetical protein
MVASSVNTEGRDNNLLLKLWFDMHQRNRGSFAWREGPAEALGMLKQIALYGLLVILAILALSPVVQRGNEIHVLFEFDLAMLLFTGVSDPYALIERYLHWYPNIGVVRIIVSGVLACLAVYGFWKLGEDERELGTTEAGRRSKRFATKDPLNEKPEAGRRSKRFVEKDPLDEVSQVAFGARVPPAEGQNKEITPKPPRYGD